MRAPNNKRRTRDFTRRHYMYVKMKDQVLIVNGMTDKIVDMFPETQPLS